MFDNFEFNPELVPNVKLGVHAVQVVVGLVIWCLEIAVFTGKESKIVGNNGWTFGVCFLSIPAWIFLICTPRFPRTRKFANPWAMFAVDVVFCIIWLSAFASQAAYNTAGLCGDRCSQSSAIVGLGVLMWLLWILSSGVSIYTVRHYRFHGELPGYDKQRIRNNDIDPDKAAFSMAPQDEDAYAPVQMDDHNDTSYGSGGLGGSGGGVFNDNPYRAGGSTTYGQEDDDPNRYGSLPSRHNAMFDAETEYNSQQPSVGPGSGVGAGPVRQPSPYAPPVVHDDPFDDHPAQFPTANYDRTMR
ncbi:hypothetical protein F5X68DRAFT_15381 [Plectosphaerella plurivora]|uniref:MARVEL domain-containing protein n=1 Tax=Plectosphaerella plurivora TaxID=936078 RepID=A0A9P8VC21_9PEZI|nr:hypothetical protein F5X68DRAFT_15381 [Plectosphaerella plurivora]